MVAFASVRKFTAYFESIQKASGSDALGDALLKQVFASSSPAERALYAKDSEAYIRACETLRPELHARFVQSRDTAYSTALKTFATKLSERLIKKGATFSQIASLDGDPNVMTHEEMQVMKQILDENNPLKIHSLSDGEKGISAQDIRNAVKDREAIAAQRWIICYS